MLIDIGLQQKQQKKTPPNSIFMDLTPGRHVIRVLKTGDSFAKSFRTHFINGATVLCLRSVGEECPKCELELRLAQEDPAGFLSNPKAFRPAGLRFAMNVFDQTPVKICESCGKEVKRHGDSFPSTCPKCGGELPQMSAPLNRVKILSGGVTLADQLNAIAGNLEGDARITDVDLVLVVDGVGPRRKITVFPSPVPGLPISVPPEDLHDLNKAVVRLGRDEMIALIRGTPLREILANRGKEGAFRQDAPKPNLVPTTNIEKIVEELFGS